MKAKTQNFVEMLTCELMNSTQLRKRAAKSSVTALLRRQRVAEELDDEAEQIFPVRRGVRTKLSAADAGTAHHKFLQHFFIESATDLKWLAAEAERLEQGKSLVGGRTRSFGFESSRGFLEFSSGTNNSETRGECETRTGIHGEIRRVRIGRNSRKEIATGFGKRIRRRAGRGGYVRVAAA